MTRSATFSAAAVAVLGAVILYAVGVALAASPPPPPPNPPTITSGPAEGSTTTSSTATFTFTYSPPRETPVTFKCALDAGNFAACSSPKTYSGLADGTHTFHVVAVQGASANGPEATRTWRIDRSAPVLTVTSPTNNGAYNAGGWAAGCSPSGLCGTATDQTGVQSVSVSLRRNSTGKYWNGSGFTSASQVFLSAGLANPGGTATTWQLSVPLPPDGSYALTAFAVDTLGNQTPAAQYAKATFVIDTVPPGPPVITAHPDTETESTTATFRYTSGDGTLSSGSFLCSLDFAPFTPCPDHITYSNLATGQHTFRVEAVDPAGNVSTIVSFTWTIGTTHNFTIAGTPIAQLYPGGPTAPVNLVFTNPESTALTVTSVTVTIAGTSTPSCPVVGNFVVAQQLTQNVTVPANSTKSLSDLGVPQANWPQLRMLDNGNQDACRNQSLSLSYSGTGNG
jgi:hypothetical protein